MSEKPEESEDLPRTLANEAAGNASKDSVFGLLASKLGEAPRVNLREEGLASLSAPLIDPSSRERHAVPRGRGNYQLMGEIARGGMGVVLKGHDTDLGRDIAVKVLDRRLAEQADTVQRFVEEAQVGGQLQHPGIVPVYELGLMEDERPYFTMKLVKGRTLAALLKEREGPEADRRKLIDIFEAVCQTMAYAHSRGVIHRDLKPSNIMVGAFGEVQVVDWGLSKVLAHGGVVDDETASRVQEDATVVATVRSGSSGSGLDSEAGAVLGTPAYMPPEQASGLVDRLDERADVFALGAILCEILTGRPPYVGGRAVRLVAAANALSEPALERLEACHVDPQLEALTRQCLQAEPEARPANAGVVAERVQRYIESVEDRARAAQVEAAEARVRAAEERRAHRLMLALGAAVVAIVLVVSGGWILNQNQRARHEHDEAERLRAEAERDRGLSAQVDASLSQASALSGAGRWGDAAKEAALARAHAESGGASEALLVRVASVQAEVEEGRRRAERRDELDRDTRVLLEELGDLHRPDDLGGGTARASAYQECFLDHGLDLLGGDVEAAVQALEERGLGTEIALVLDAWSAALNRASDESGAVRLLELAHAVDSDPARADLREALFNGETPVLEAMANGGLEGQPADTLALLASGLAQLESTQAALKVYRAGVLHHPGHFGLVYGLGKLLSPKAGSSAADIELEEAVANLRAALALAPGSAQVRKALGVVLRRLRRFEEAIEQLEIATAELPDDAWARQQLARSYMQAGRFEQATGLFERNAEANSQGWLPALALHYLATMRLERGDVEGGLEQARRSMDVAPAFRTHSADLLVAFAKASAALGSDEPMHEARRILADRLEGDWRALDSFAERVVEFVTDGHDPDLLTGAATHSSLVPRRDSRIHGLLLTHAIEMSERAVQASEGDPDPYYTLGLARYHNGDFEGALEALQECSRRYGRRYGPDKPVQLYLYLCLAHQALGHEKAARRWSTLADEGMEQNPSHPYLLELRERAMRLLGPE